MLKKRLMFRVMMLGLPLATLVACNENETSDKVIPVSPEDTSMNAAIEKARGRLSVFWQEYAHPAVDEDSFNLKLRLTDGKNVEHFWCEVVTGDGSSATCTINNDAESVHTVKIGDRVQVDFSTISDWMYRKNGKILGGETIRALLLMMSVDEAQATREQLADP